MVACCIFVYVKETFKNEIRSARFNKMHPTTWTFKRTEDHRQQNRNPHRYVIHSGEYATLFAHLLTTPNYN